MPEGFTISILGTMQKGTPVEVLPGPTWQIRLAVIAHGYEQFIAR